MNVIRFSNQNTLNTKVKQIRNPQKEISGGFFIQKNEVLNLEDIPYFFLIHN